MNSMAVLHLCSVGRYPIRVVCLYSTMTYKNVVSGKIVYAHDSDIGHGSGF